MILIRGMPHPTVRGLSVCVVAAKKKNDQADDNPIALWTQREIGFNLLTEQPSFFQIARPLADHKSILIELDAVMSL
jgi:hypothetical protein